MRKKVALVIGAGPAGLTAAYELATRTDIKPIVIEMEPQVGGLSTTLEYKGNKIDLGGHRFFTKSKRVMDFWFTFLPPLPDKDLTRISYHGKSIRLSKKFTIKNSEEVMVTQKRLSRIYYQGNFFNYPLKLNFSTLWQLGIIESLLIFLSYLSAEIRPRKPEVSLEDFFINRFGNRLYQKFFKTYTEKVWGENCSEMPALWGAQRVKGLSVRKAIFESFKKEKTETSLIEKFLYPKYGPGQLWSIVARETKKHGGKIHLSSEVKKIERENNGFLVTYSNSRNEEHTIQADYVFSSVPMKYLTRMLTPRPPKVIQTIAQGLPYRDFIVVGLLLRKLSSDIQDTWLYIHDPMVKVGRIQMFNNWSKDLVADPTTQWIGMEYFCSQGDDFWSKTDKEIKEIAIKELFKLKLAHKNDFIDGTVIRVYKAYPAYTGTYAQFDQLKDYFNSINNLFLIGRNGMHKYNNQDHSMLTAMTAVDNLIKKKKDPSNIWSINTEDDYHEQK